MQALPLLEISEREERIEAAQTGIPVRRPWRLVRATTKAAWRAVRDTLPTRERAVFWALMAFWNRHQQWPTGMELLEFCLAVKARNPRHPRYRLFKDVNSVRPRLTCMNQKDPAVVVTGPKRRCTSVHASKDPNRRPVFTWRIPQLGEPVRHGKVA